MDSINQSDVAKEDANEARRYVYQTRGVCPPEIHFRLKGDILEKLRFVGGGCPGNAQLVARLLEGRPAGDVLPYLAGVECRNGASCPDQLARALMEVESGALTPAGSFRVYEDPSAGEVVGLIGELGGADHAFKEVMARMEDSGVQRLYCIGNLTGETPENTALIKRVRKRKIPIVLGHGDWRCARGEEGAGATRLKQTERDWLIRQPHVLTFEMGGRTGMAFYGDYLQDLPGFSDFDPFALEMNMVCGLTDYMRDETVFPALEAMAAQFKASIIIFSQARRWGHWHVAGVDFISLGPAADSDGFAWGLLTMESGGVRFRKIRDKQRATNGEDT